MGEESLINPEWVTAKGAAQEYSIAESTLRYWVDKGKVERRPLSGKMILYRRADIVRMMTGREKGEGKE